MEHLDLDLRRDTDEPSAPAPDISVGPYLLSTPAPGPSIAPYLLAVPVILAVAIGAYFFLRGREPVAPPARAAQPPAPARAATPPAPLGGEPEVVVVPPLDESDAFVRGLAKMLSGNPGFLSWLATDDLIRTFTLTVVNVADGHTPAKHLRVMRPRGRFVVRERGEDIYADARSYERYTPVADALASIDPGGSARLYATLKPRIEDAFRELGYPDTPFDQTLERALVLLLATPISDQPAELQPGGAIGYRYADPKLERLTAAQKQLLRLGPRNARAVQASLRNIAAALGIPPDRLPPRP